MTCNLRHPMDFCPSVFHTRLVFCLVKMPWLICSHVCLFVRLLIGMFVCMQVCLFVCMHVYMYAGMRACLFAHIFVCMFACMYTHTHTYLPSSSRLWLSKSSFSRFNSCTMHQSCHTSTNHVKRIMSHMHHTWMPFRFRAAIAAQPIRRVTCEWIMSTESCHIWRSHTTRECISVFARQ